MAVNPEELEFVEEIDVPRNPHFKPVRDRIPDTSELEFDSFIDYQPNIRPHAFSKPVEEKRPEVDLSRPAPDGSLASGLARAGRKLLGFPEASEEETPMLESVGTGLMSIPDVAVTKPLGGGLQYIGEREQAFRHALEETGKEKNPLVRTAKEAWETVKNPYGAIKHRIIEALPTEQKNISRIDSAMLAERGKEIIKGANQRLQTLAPDKQKDSPVGYYLNSALSGGASMIPAMGAAIITKNPEVALPTLMGSVKLSHYGDLREKGYDENAAGTLSTIKALTEGIPEKFVLDDLFKLGKPGLNRLLNAPVNEGVSEMITEALDIGVEQGLLNKDVPVYEAISRVVDAGLVGGMMGFGLAGGAEIANRRRSGERKTDEEYSQELQEWMGRQESILEEAKAAVSRKPGSEAPKEPEKTGAKPKAVPGIAATSLPQEAQALLASIYGTEAPDYRTIYGGQKFDSFEDHPRISVPIESGPNKGKTSSAAGRPQFLASTWDAQAKKLGLKDFSPENQDIAAWDLAETEYKKKTGRDLLGDLRGGIPLGAIGQALKGQWTSLPSGIEQGTTASSFEKRYREHLSSAGFPVSPVQEEVLRGDQGVSLAEPDETESEFEAFNRRALERARKRRKQPEIEDEETQVEAKAETDAILTGKPDEETMPAARVAEDGDASVVSGPAQAETDTMAVPGGSAPGISPKAEAGKLYEAIEAAPDATLSTSVTGVTTDAARPRPQVGQGLAPPPIEAQDAKQIQQAEAIDVGSGQQQGIRQESASIATGSQGVRQGGQKKEVGIQPGPDSGAVARKAPAIAIKLTPAKDTSQEDLNYIAGIAGTLNEKGLESRLNGRFGRPRVLQWKSAGMLQQWGREANQSAPAQASMTSAGAVAPKSQGMSSPVLGASAISLIDIDGLLNSAEIKGLRVKVRAVVEETGDTVTLEENADEAIREVRGRIEILKQLRECVLT